MKKTETFLAIREYIISNSLTKEMINVSLIAKKYNLSYLTARKYVSQILKGGK